MINSFPEHGGKKFISYVNLFRKSTEFYTLNMLCSCRFLLRSNPSKHNNDAQPTLSYNILLYGVNCALKTQK